MISGPDAALDEALERLRLLVDAVVAVRSEHAPALHRRGLFRRPARVCACCRAAFPCRTVLALRSTRVAGT